jgi:hypothetical protein
MKADLRISINDYRRNKSLKVPLFQAPSTKWNRQRRRSSEGPERSGLRYFKLLSNPARRPFLDFAVTWHAGDFSARRVEPDGMSASLPIQSAAVEA